MALDKRLNDPSYTPAPTEPVRDTSDAAIVETAVGVGEQLFKHSVTSKFRREVEDIEGQYIKNVIGEEEATDGEPESFQNEAAVREFKSEAERAQDAVKQGIMTGNQARVKLEATLKSYMANHPYFSQDFQRIVSETTGFNPAGTAFRLAEELERERAQAGHDALKDIIAKAKEYDMDLTVLQTDPDAFIAEYKKHSARERAYTEAQQEYNLRKLHHQDNANAQSTLIADEVPFLLGELQRQVVDITGPLRELSTEAFLARIGEDGPAMRDQLDNARRAVKAQLRAKYNHLSPSEIDNYVAPIDAMFDDYISVVNGEKRLEDVQRNIKLRADTAELFMRQDPEVNRALFFIETAKGLPETLTTAIQTRQGTDKSILKVLDAVGFSLDNPRDSNPLGSLNSPKERSDFLSILDGAWQNAKDASVQMGPTEIQEMGNLIMSATNDMIERPTRVPNSWHKNIFNIVADPEFLDQMQKYEGWDDLRENLYAGMDNYMSRMALTLGNDLSSELGDSPSFMTGLNMPIDRRGKKVGSLAEVVDVAIDGSNIRFAVKEGKGTPSARSAVAKLNKVYGKEINKLAKAYSHIRGDKNYATTINEMSQRIFSNIEPFKSMLSANSGAGVQGGTR